MNRATTTSADDVPHFDREGHLRAQEQQEQRRKRRTQIDGFNHDREGSILFKFLLVSGVVVLAYGVSSTIDKIRSHTPDRRSDEVS